MKKILLVCLSLWPSLAQAQILPGTRIAQLGEYEDQCLREAHSEGQANRCRVIYWTNREALESDDGCQREIRGYIVQALNRHTYEVVLQVPPNAYLPTPNLHALLKTTNTVFYRRGSFHMCVAWKVGSKQVSMGDGFTSLVAVLTEDDN